jgi:putative radical SAM enzyme (TIGR03279 family)
MYEFAVTPATTQIRRRGVEISEVAPASLAAELELAAGDRVTKVNGRAVRDYLDFRFATGGETELVINVIKPTGEEWEIDLEREEGEDFGITFEQIVPRQCANECLFCFCKGNPADARPALFVRDEDIRLSFLYGNYTTLTSITEAEMTRVIEQHLSPQYVSVHATDVAVRAHLLGIDEPRADISAKLTRMIEAGIEIHAQVVLCPGINDGAILQRTISDLAALHPHVKSCAVVPLGLTRYNTDSRLTPVTPEFCREVIKQIKPLQAQLRRTLGTTFAFLGDEIYLRAGRAVPGRRHYGDYPQIEDGVGMVRSFHEDYRRLCRSLESDSTALQIEREGGLRLTVATGTLFAPLLSAMLNNLNECFGTKLKTLAVSSCYFGGDVGVAGLMTGSDILPLSNQIEGDALIIPSTAIKSDEPVMLDGMLLIDLQRQLGLPVYAVDFAGLARIIKQERESV